MGYVGSREGISSFKGPLPPRNRLEESRLCWIFFRRFFFGKVVPVYDIYNTINMYLYYIYYIYIRYIYIYIYISYVCIPITVNPYNPMYVIYSIDTSQSLTHKRVDIS